MSDGSPVVAICPGSYDPVTYGHVDIIRRAAEIFDRVVVGVVREPTHKGTLFTVSERVAFLEGGIEGHAQMINDIRESFSHLDKRFDQLEVRLDQRFAAIDQRFAVIDQRFAAIDQRFALVDGRLDKISAQLSNLLIGVVAAAVGGVLGMIAAIIR